MGYHECHCQLCGVMFNIARVRCVGEPPSAGWDNLRRGVQITGIFRKEADKKVCERAGCMDDEQNGHTASEGCVFVGSEDCQAYDGRHISFQEMDMITRVQCLHPKAADWEQQVGDDDFEVAAAYCYLTTPTLGGPYEDQLDDVPQRHGEPVDGTLSVDNAMEDEETAIPLHMPCFDIFKRLSQAVLGHVDLDGLWVAIKEYPEFSFLETRPDVRHVMEQSYSHAEGSEYLAANPVEVPLMLPLLESCVDAEAPVMIPSSAEMARIESQSQSDMFSILSPEIRLLVLEQLRPTDVAQLRIASRTFRQLPQAFFHHLIRTEMPWLWEIKDVESNYNTIDWYKLWSKLLHADGGKGIWVGDGGIEGEGRVTFSLTERYYTAHAHALMPNSVSWYQWEADRARGSDLDIAEKKAEKVIFAERKRKREEETLPVSYLDVSRQEGRIKGLMNRRRIWQDVEQIVQKVAELRALRGGDDRVASYADRRFPRMY